jgi:hypothetical protein
MNPLPADQFMRELWLRLYQQYGMSAQTVTVKFAAGKLRLRLPEVTLQAPAEQSGSDIGNRILAVLGEADRPLKAQAVANRAGAKFNSHFKQILTRLKREGQIVLTPDGYSIPEEPEDEAET